MTCLRFGSGLRDVLHSRQRRVAPHSSGTVTRAAGPALGRGHSANYLTCKVSCKDNDSPRRTGLQAWLIVAVALPLLVAGFSHADDFILSDAQKEKLQTTQKVLDEALKLRAEGALAKAIELGTQWLDAQEEVYGNERLPVSSALERWVSWNQEFGDYDIAASRLAKIRDARKMRLGNDHWEVQRIQSWLDDGEHIKTLSTNDQAELRRAGQLLAKVLIDRSAGRYAETLESTLELQALRRKLFPMVHNTWALSEYSLGILCANTGKLPEAQQHFEAALSILEQLSHVDESLRLLCLRELATAAANQKLFDVSLKAIGDARKVARTAYGIDSQEECDCLMLHDDIERFHGDGEAASKILDELLVIVRRREKAESIAVADVLQRQAWLFVQIGKNLEALDKFEVAARTYVSNGEQKSPGYLFCREQQGALCAGMMRKSDAEGYYREALEVAEALHGRNSLIRVEILLKFVPLILSHDPSAESLLVEARSALENMEAGRKQPQYVRVLELQSQLARDRKQWPEELKLRTDILELQDELHGKESAQSALASNELGVVHSALGNGAEAAKVFGRASELARQLDSPSFESRFLERKAKALELTGDKAEAEAARLQADAINEKRLDLGDKSGYSTGFLVNFERELSPDFHLTECKPSEGKLELAPGAVLARAVKAGPVIEVSFNGKLNDVAEKERRQFLVVFVRSADEKTVVEVLGTRLEGKPHTQLKISRVATDEKKETTVTLDRQIHYSGELAEDWKIRVNYGLVQIENGGKPIGMGYAATSANYFTVVGINQRAGSLTLRELGVRSSPRLKAFDGQDKDEALRLNAEFANLTQAGKYTEALATMDQLLELTRNVCGASSPLLFHSMNGRATALGMNGRAADAENAYADLQKFADQLYGRQHPESAYVMASRARFYDSQQMLQPALEQLREALTILIETCGVDHSRTQLARIEFASVLHELNNAKASREQLEEVIALEEKKAEPNYEVLLKAMDVLSSRLRYAGEFEDSKRVAESHYKVCLSKFGATHDSTINALKELSSTLRRMSNFEGAKKCVDEALKAAEELHGGESTAVASLWQYKGQILSSESNYLMATEAFEKSIAILRKMYPQNDTDLASSLYSLAEHCVDNLADPARGQALAEEALKITQLRFGEEGIGVIGIQGTISQALRQQRKFVAALNVTNWSIESLRKNLGPKHPDVASHLHQAAIIEEELHDYDQARKLHEEALGIRRESLGPRHLEVARSLYSLGYFLRDRREFDSARKMLNEALEIRRERVGENSPLVATSLTGLAMLKRSEGDFPAALLLHQQATAILEQLNDPVSLSIALDDNADLLGRMGRYSEAEKMLLRSQKIREDVYGKKHLEVSYPLNNRAYLAFLENRNADAAKLYEQVLELREKSYGRMHPLTADALHMLGYTLGLQGEQVECRKLMEEALAIREKTLLGDDLDLASSHSGIAEVLIAQGDAATASVHIEFAQRLREKVLPKDHPDLIPVFHTKAQSLLFEGKIDEALQVIDQIVEIQKRNLGVNHPDVIGCTILRGSIEGSRGNHEQAAKAFDEAAKLVDSRTESTPAIRLIGMRAAMLGHVARKDFTKVREVAEQARNLCEEIYGVGHPQTIALADMQMQYEIGVGRFDEARRMLSELVSHQINFARKQFDSLSEVEALLLVEAAFGSQRFLAAYGSIPNSSATEAYEPVWATKGMLGQELVDRRRHLESRPEVQDLWKEVQQARVALSQEIFAAPDVSDEGRAERMSRLNQAKEDAERRLAAASRTWKQQRDNRTASYADMAKRLPSDVAIVDFVRTFRWSTDPTASTSPEDYWQYDAFILRSSNNKDGYQLEWKHLGSAVRIDKAIQTMRASILGEQPSEGAVASPEEFLSKELWRPMESSLAGCRTIILIPDGDLAILPWNALPGRRPQSYLLEDYALAVVSHGKQVYDVLSRSPATLDNPTALLVGGLDYDASPQASSDQLVASQTRAAVSLRGGEFPNWTKLNETGEEVDRLAEFWKAPESSRVIKGLSASEESLRDAMSGRQIIHLATHGFFADQQRGSHLPIDDAQQLLMQGSIQLKGYRSTVTSRNPLLLSGLVVSGANALRARARGVGNSGDDGILTAEEIAMTDLSSAEVVVLSACETGLGHTASGEGVFGLQRAFQSAGARTTITSLWKVDDASTRALMIEFYRNLLERKLSRLEALRQAQLTVLKSFDPATGKLRGVGGQTSRQSRPAYWAAFVLSGDWR